MSNIDMSEAIKLLANEKNISVETLLHVLVEALASAYKRRTGAAPEVEVSVDPQTMEFTFIGYDVDEEGNWVNPRRHASQGGDGSHRGSDLPSGDGPEDP